ncbi:TPA: TIGR03757 family integrating conjugative element protein, partial [Klebsiella pneumoniae]|nr:TIGR03757 family integrating conjugative element protein [Klebsiella pneumoniae]HBU0077921.1 TIGR03757 family integrating conjugative element protein [Klebsiella pneumoniae]
MKLTSLVFLPALLPASVLAGTVAFTDSQHLP